MEQKLGWYAHPAFEKWAPAFEEKYQMIDLVRVGDANFAKNKTHIQEGRHCIFCNKSHPQTTFKKAAHLLSRMIEHRSLLNLRMRCLQ